MGYTKSDCVSSILDAKEQASGYLGAEDYRDWMDEDDPSVATIHNKFGSWSEAKEQLELETSDSTKTPDNARYIDVDYFNHMDDETAYWLGFIYADAHVTDSSSDGRPRFSLKLAYKDKEHLLRFKETIGSEHKICYDDGQPSIQTTRADFINSILQHNLRGDKTSNGSLPDFDDSSLLKHWFRGLFDGDGYERYHAGSPNITISNSYQRLDNLHEKLPADGTLKVESGGRIDFYGDCARDIAYWMYPEGEETEPKLERKFPNWY